MTTYVSPGTRCSRPATSRRMRAWLTTARDQASSRASQRSLVTRPTPASTTVGAEIASVSTTFRSESESPMVGALHPHDGAAPGDARPEGAHEHRVPVLDLARADVLVEQDRDRRARRVAHAVDVREHALGRGLEADGHLVEDARS